MFPADFAYARAASVPHALDLLAAAQAAGEEAKLLAGGQSLLPMMKLRLAVPQTVIDIGGVTSLKGTAVSGTSITIGALATYRELRHAPGVTERHPAIADALAVLADPQVRARGTVGGAVAHGDPAADLPAVLLAFDAQVEITARHGTRSVRLDDFLQGVFTTDLAEDEIVTALVIPQPPPAAGAAVRRGEAYVKFPHPASHLPLAGACAVVTVTDGIISSAEVAVTGISPRPYRARDTERTLASAEPAPDSLAAAAAHVADSVVPLSDQHASGPYRVHLAEVLTRRALARALARAGAAWPPPPQVRQ